MTKCIIVPMTGTVSQWLPCRTCGAITQHDYGRCIRDPRHIAMARFIARFGEAHMRSVLGLHPDPDTEAP